MRARLVLAAALAVLVPLALPASAATTVHARHTASGWAYADPHATPGAVLTTSATTVCRPGYAGSVRAVSTATKQAVYAEYGIKSHRTYAYEVDHDISLELGGSNAMSNLWPEPNDKARGNSKDKLENRLHSLVCSGQMTLPTAQHLIRGNWTGAYKTYVGPLGTFHQNAAGTGTATTTKAPPSGRPAGATARCNDGTYSHAVHHQGACSHHGGVAVFY